jgi:seryl-tRNA(Sec) selenium transferase
MTNNERQYRITKAQAAKLEAALESFSAQTAGDRKTHPRLIKAQADALRSQFESLHDELCEYDDIKR